MERYRIEPQPQSHYGLANVGSGPNKYQLQQFRPVASYGADIENKYAYERQYNKYDGIDDGACAGPNGNTNNIYRERDLGNNASGSYERAAFHPYSDHQQQQQQQQRQPSHQWECSETTHQQRDQSHSPGGRRYHFGGRGGRRAGGGTDGQITDSNTADDRVATASTRPTRSANSSAISTTRTSVRERERVASEEKPILRSEHQRHSR